jgi:hypothetical protein
MIGIFQGGVIVPKTPTDVPDGTEVRIQILQDHSHVGMREEDWPTTPEGIAALIAEWRQLEPLVFTPEEEAELRASRKWWREQELDQLRRDRQS